LNRDQLVQLLKVGAQLHQSEAMEFNDYDLDATATEYLLTACLLRAALQAHSAARVEALCKRVVNLLTSHASVATRKGFGKQRLDFLIGSYSAPLALVEVKIGVRSAVKLAADIDKILKTVAYLDKVRASVLGAVVYEVHVPGSRKFATNAQFNVAMSNLAMKIQAGLNEHLLSDWPNVLVTHVEIGVALGKPRYRKGASCLVEPRPGSLLRSCSSRAQTQPRLKLNESATKER